MKVTYYGRTESGKLSQTIICGHIGKEFKTAIWIITPDGKRFSVKRADIISIEEETRYQDIETGETITAEQLKAEYMEQVNAGEVDAHEKPFNAYLHNCLVEHGGTLKRL